ncbi:nuclear transport factor 2 family protein [Pseudochelatococcus sp. B33]
MTRDEILDADPPEQTVELTLRRLIARYAHVADAGDQDRFVALFTVDGTWTRENSPPAEAGGSGLPPEVRQGEAALRELLQGSIVDRFKRKFRHQMTDVVIAAGRGVDEAHGLCRALITNWRDGPGKLAMSALYQWEFRRISGVWKVASVSVRVLPE